MFPILSGSDGGASHVDYEKTFGDASFVITQVLGLGGGDPLAGLVDRDRIAAAGHSDGEVVSFGLGFLACCRDPRVKAVISMAGDLANANNPSVRDTGTPILHIMEMNDEYDPYPHSIQWDRDNLTAPRWMVSLQSSHVPPYTQPGDPAFELVSTITIAYLDGTLKEHPERLDEVTSDGAGAARRGCDRAMSRRRRSAAVPGGRDGAAESTISEETERSRARRAGRRSGVDHFGGGAQPCPEGATAQRSRPVGVPNRRGRPSPGGAGSCRWRSGAPRRRRRPARGS